MVEITTQDCVVFLIGTAIGSAGTYFGNKYTDRRREGESRQREKKAFREVLSKMPELIGEMKADLEGPGNELIREFFVSRRGCTINMNKPCFTYFENDHENLRNKILILVNHGYVVDVTPHKTPMFRMTEEFAELIAKHG